MRGNGAGLVANNLTKERKGGGKCMIVSFNLAKVLSDIFKLRSTIDRKL